MAVPSTAPCACCFGEIRRSIHTTIVAGNLPAGTATRCPRPTSRRSNWRSAVWRSCLLSELGMWFVMLGLLMGVGAFVAIDNKTGPICDAGPLVGGVVPNWPPPSSLGTTVQKTRAGCSLHPPAQLSTRRPRCSRPRRTDGRYPAARQVQGGCQYPRSHPGYADGRILATPIEYPIGRTLLGSPRRTAGTIGPITQAGTARRQFP